MLTTAIVSMIWGVFLLPINFSPLSFSPKDLEVLGFWPFIGLILIGTGIFTLIKEVIFSFRSLGNTSGEWHFSLISDTLIWNVPNHFHGNEVGFKAKLSEIKEIEFRTINRHEEINQREYWVHFYKRESILLQSYSGISISSLVSKTCNEGVHYNETQIEQ
jgi:hypothetical protein